MSVYVKFEDGTAQRFVCGESAAQGVKYEGGFAIITDKNHVRTAIPAEKIKSITDNRFFRG